MRALTEVQLCIGQSERGRECPGETGTPAGLPCVCAHCTVPFQRLAANFTSVPTVCSLNASSAVGDGALQVLATMPCLAETEPLSLSHPALTACPDPTDFLCGNTRVRERYDGHWPNPSRYATGKCATALSASCSSSLLAASYGPPEVPVWCGKCDAEAGICPLRVHSTQGHVDLNMSVVDLVCSPTSLVASAMVHGPPGGTTGNYTVSFLSSPDVNVSLPSPYWTPPLLTSLGGQYDAVNCSAGLVCYGGYVSTCYSGQACTDDQNSVPCPPGTFSPEAISTCLPCAWLDDCSGMGQEDRIQWQAAVALGAIIVAALLACAVCAALDSFGASARRRRRRQPRRASSSSDADERAPLLGTRGNSTVPVREDEGEHAIVVSNLSVPGRLSCSTAWFTRGKVNIIVGTSGAGKSSLLSALTGSLPVDDGISFSSSCAASWALVPQFSAFPGELTIRDVVLYAWRMAECPGESVDSLLAALDLGEVADTRIRDASGGQKKRASVAFALVSAPSLLLLDEPTTSLDASTALSVVTLLRSLCASRGITVVAVLHQPRSEIAALVDGTVVLLVGGGRVGYCGDVAGAPGAAEVERSGESWSERVLNAASEVGAGETLADEWEAKAGLPGRPDPLPVPKVHPPRLASAPRQVAAHLRRTLWQLYRSPSTFATLLLVNALAGGFLGGGFAANPGSLFIPPLPAALGALCPFAVRDVCTVEPINWQKLKLSIFFLSLILGVGTMTSYVGMLGRKEEVSLVRRLRPSALGYFMGKGLAEIPLLVATSVAFSAPFLVLLRPLASWYWHLLLIAAMQAAISGTAHLLSMATADGNSANGEHAAMNAGMTLVLVSTILGGIQPKLAEAISSAGPARLLWDTSFARFATEALVSLESAPFSEEEAFRESMANFGTGYGWEVGGAGFARCVAVLFGLAAVWRLLAAAVLAYRLRR